MAITASSLLQSLLPEFSQETRLLQLTTPLGRDKLLAECVRGEESISGGFVFAISALSTDADIALKSLIGQPALLQLLTAHSRDEMRPFHGHIIEVEHSGSNGGFARYKLTIGPWTSFLGLGRDSRVFQDMSVFDIIDAVFGEYQGKGALVPAWRFEVADRDVYPIRSLTTQYQESNLAFVERLMAEEGLFHFFEHSGAPGSAPFGSHTMIIADHNGSFQPNVQSQIRFTQSGAVMKEDGMDRWRTELRQQTNALELSSWDYRSLDHRPLSTASADGGATLLLARDTLGPYAYESRKQGQRMADHQMQGLTARKEVHIAAGTVRTLAPGTTFTLQGQALFDAADNDDARTFLVLRTVHLMHNNLSAELKADVISRLKPAALALLIDDECANSLHAVGTQKGERPLYRNRIDAIRSSTPYRTCVFDTDGRARFQRPTIRGQQTAIVVGPAGSVIHTDRDHRVKVQFHWQRGAQSHSRLDHPAAANHTGAPADDTAGTWVRVATPLAPVAGANWGSHALPRVGQEVLVDFFEGDIDRPVVIGALYNGSGQADQQHNKVGQGAGVSTGNAPPWFPGEAGAHAHPAVLSGIKTQSMNTSQAGAGAYNQLVMDDSEGQSRLSLQRHAAAHKGTDELNLGHLRHQTDNQRLQPAGFGAELKTEFSAALRAGKGILLSTNARGNATGSQLDSSEASAQVRSSMELQKAMASTAQKHNAKLEGEPAPDKLPAIERMAGTIAVLEAKTKGSTVKEDTGGTGEVAAYSAAQIQLSAVSGIVATTPASAFFSAGRTSSITAGHDINLAAQGNQFHSVLDGISLFTYGKASKADKPNQEVGIKLHAASGKVQAQSQSGEIRFTADKAITVTSVTKNVTVAAKENVLMTAQGAFLKIEGGNIMLHGPGKIEFKASKKELKGPADGSFGVPELPKAKPKYDEQFVVKDELSGLLMAYIPYCIVTEDGKEHTGVTDEHGCTQRIFGTRPENIEFHFGGPPSARKNAEAPVVAAESTSSEVKAKAPVADSKSVGANSKSALVEGAPAAKKSSKSADEKVPAGSKQTSYQPPKAPLNPVKNSTSPVEYKACTAYFRPETFEIILVPEKARAKFEKHANENCWIVDQYHKANQSAAQVIDAYEKLRQKPAGPLRDKLAIKAQKDHIDAYEEVRNAHARFRNRLADLDSLKKFADGGVGIVELVPLRPNHQPGRRMVYVLSTEIDPRWDKILLADKPKSSNEKGLNTTAFKEAGEDIIKRDPVTRKKSIDIKKMLAQAFDPKKFEAKHGLFSFEDFQDSGALTDWARAFNSKAKFSSKGRVDGPIGKWLDDHVELKAEAQVLRYVVGAGGDLLWKPGELRAGIKVAGQAQLSLGEAKVSLTMHAPNRLGCDIATFDNWEGTKEYPVGLFRVEVEAVLAGLLGAHAAGELGIEFGKGTLDPAPLLPGDPGPPPLPDFDGTRKIRRLGAARPSPTPTPTPVPGAAPAKTHSPAKGGLEVFGGLKGDLDCVVLLQWWDYEETEQKWSDFAKFSPGISAMAGGARAVKFEVIYRNGKFGLIFEATACWGLGGRGKIAFEVDAGMIVKFIIWFAQQLARSNYDFLPYVSARAFEAIKNIQFLTILGDTAQQAMRDTVLQINEAVRDVQEALEKSDRRTALAKKIVRENSFLRYSTPETKGMLLYLLTRHGKADITDTSFEFTKGYDKIIDRYLERKTAVLEILKWVQTKEEWRKVMCRVTPEGKKHPQGNHWEDHLIRFLDEGQDRSKEMLAIKARLRDTPRVGKVVRNDTAAYRMN